MGIERLFFLHDGFVGTLSAVLNDERLQATNLPPVEVEEFGTLTTSEGKVEIMGFTIYGFTIYDLTFHIDRQRLPFLPPAGGRHLQASKELSMQTVEAHLYLTATQATGYAGNELLRHVKAKVHIL